MQLNQRILSDLIIHMKYARYLHALQRRELWPEICDRYATMLIGRYPAMQEEIRGQMQFVLDKKVLPSMRAMQFAGTAIERNNSRIYNCAYTRRRHPRVFRSDVPAARRHRRRLLRTTRAH